MHGHGALHLQTSNQSPDTFQLGTFFVLVVDTVDDAISLNARLSILVLHKSRGNFLGFF